jgi:hypothetical protein
LEIDMDYSIVNTALQNIAKIVNNIRDNFTNYYSDRSLTESTKLTRVEPLTIISKDCLNLEYMQDVQQGVLSIFCGYYLQAISLLTKVNDVEVVRILDKLNPDRDETGFLLDERLSRESIHTLVLENYQYSLPTSSRIALEEDLADTHGTGPDKDTMKSLNEISALSVGKMLNVEIAYTKCAGDEEVLDNPIRAVKIPINVRLMASVIPNSTIGHLLTYKTEDNGIVERFHAWRSGRIGFIKDLIFCQDLIDEFKKATVGDETDTMQEIIRRVNNSKKYGLLTKNPSLVSASNIFIFSEEVAREVESKLGGKLSNHRIRQKAFENTYAMMIVVIDREWERVTFYSRGIAASTDLSIKEIKFASKGKGPELMDILKSFNQGLAPSF